MKRLFTFFFLFLFYVGSANASAPRDPGEHFFDTAFGDFTEELANAREQGKEGILIMFEMDECPFCHRMKSMVLNQAHIQDYYKANFLIFTVDIEGDVEIVDFDGQDTTMKDFAFKQHRVRATPAFQFFDLNGKAIKRARYTGATPDAETFLLLGQYVAEGVYKESSFTRYKRNMRNK